MKIIRSIQNCIYELRGTRVILGFDLAALYEVETRALNQAVKRNSKWFPEDFMFRITGPEYESIKYQVDAVDQGMSSQIVITYPNKRPNIALPLRFYRTRLGHAQRNGKKEKGSVLKNKFL